MSTKKLSHEYVDGNTKHNTANVINKINIWENKLGKNINEWDQEDYESWLRALKLTSLAYRNYTKELNNYLHYILNKLNLELFSFKAPSEEEYLNKVIDTSCVTECILSYDEYLELISQLPKREPVQPRIMVELAWLGLTTEEIQRLKVQDVDFQDKKAVITTSKNQYVVTDKDVIEDLVTCINELEYHIENAYGKVDTIRYKENDYLIKSTQAGVKPKKNRDGMISSPTVKLQTFFKKLGIKIEGVDLARISLSSIRKSYWAYLQEIEGATPEDIAIFANQKSSLPMMYTKKVAKKKYK